MAPTLNMNTYYREDKSLEKINYTLSDGTSIYLFSESEYLKEWSLSYNNGYKVIYRYDAEEKKEENYYDGVLNDIYYYRFEDGNYSGWVYKYEWYENGILRRQNCLNENYRRKSFEYFDDNGNLEYKDFYDEDGNFGSIPNIMMRGKCHKHRLSLIKKAASWLLYFSSYLQALYWECQILFPPDAW